MRLDVPVDHAPLVGVLQAQGRLPGVGARLGHRQRAALAHQLGEAGPLDVLHDEEVQGARLVGVVGPHDVGVVEPGRRPRLLLEALHRRRPQHQAGVDDLQGHHPVHADLLGPVDRPHAPLADQAEHAVAGVIDQLRRDGQDVGDRDAGVGAGVPAGVARRDRAGGAQPAQETVAGRRFHKFAAAFAAGQVLFQGRGGLGRQTALAVRLQLLAARMIGSPIDHGGFPPSDQK